MVKCHKIDHMYAQEPGQTDDSSLFLWKYFPYKIKGFRPCAT